jgi:glycosyltransferase involved in cell wall biosynthesis
VVRMSFLSRLLKKDGLEEDNHIKYNKEGYYIRNKDAFFKEKQSKVSVITPVYNAERFLRKTVDSVIQQTIGFGNIEYLLIDDGSTDGSRQLLLEYADRYKNIIVVFLKNNTGTPARPRNLGIELARSKYITFLDADDWLAPDGLKILYDILEETGDGYAVGKTIHVGSKSSRVVGEWESLKERRSLSPFSIPYLFHHLGPRARMVRSDIINDHRIRFPEMKYAEDKQFFIDVLINCDSVSTTTETIYYLNRLDDNRDSLISQTDIFHRMDCNIQVIRHVKKKHLEEDKEKIILNRLYEYDSITRVFNRKRFLQSDHKEKYYDKFRKVLETTKDLRYDFVENFVYPINQAAYELFRDGRYKDLERLFRWERNEKLKDYIIKENLPYMVTPLKGEYEHIRVPMLALFKTGRFTKDRLQMEFEVYGDFMDEINDVILRDRKEASRECSIEVEMDGHGNGKIEVGLDLLNEFPSSSYFVFLRYGDYKRINIVRQDQVKYKNRTFQFYTTVNSNLGFKIEK